jgi:hypothetical protein
MTLKIHRLRQVAASVFVVLSLCVSSVSACACAHHSHPEKAEAETPSCHSQAHTEEAAGQPAVKDSADASCECILQSPSKVFVKSEKLKLEKQAVLAKEAGPSIVFETAAALSASPNLYSLRFFTQGDFHNLTPGRAPPRL